MVQWFNEFYLWASEAAQHSLSACGLLVLSCIGSVLVSVSCLCTLSSTSLINVYNEKAVMKIKLVMLVCCILPVGLMAMFKLGQQWQPRTVLGAEPCAAPDGRYVGSLLNVDQFNELWLRENGSGEERCLGKVVPLVGFVARITNKTMGDGIAIELRGLTALNVPTFYLDPNQDVKNICVGDAIAIEGICESKLIFKKARVLSKLQQGKEEHE